MPTHFGHSALPYVDLTIERQQIETMMNAQTDRASDKELIARISFAKSVAWKLAHAEEMRKLNEMRESLGAKPSFEPHEHPDLATYFAALLIRLGGTSPLGQLGNTSMDAISYFMLSEIARQIARMMQIDPTQFLRDCGFLIPTSRDSTSATDGALSNNGTE